MTDHDEPEYHCDGCDAVRPSSKMSWPDVCDGCYWIANLGANFIAAGLAATVVQEWDQWRWHTRRLVARRAGIAEGT